MLKIPNYIRQLNIAAEPITYKWRDPDSQGLWLTGNDRLWNAIGSLPDDRIRILSCGFAEWIAWRLHKLDPDLMLLNRIEAIYKLNDTKNYKLAGLPPIQEYRGAIKGPIWQAAYLLDKIIKLQNSSQGGASPESASLSILAAYVVPDPKIFIKWRRETIRRLENLSLNRDGLWLGKEIS